MRRTASQAEVERALPLLSRLAAGIDEKAALLLYLDALARIAAGTLTLVRREGSGDTETIVVRTTDGEDEWSVACPAALPREIEALAVAEYRRRIVGERLSAMDTQLFAHLFGPVYCANCRYRGERQICFECRYAAEPVNFLPSGPRRHRPCQPGSYGMPPGCDMHGRYRNDFAGAERPLSG